LPHTIFVVLAYIVNIGDSGAMEVRHGSYGQNLGTLRTRRAIVR